jgi:hypothetical protein
MSDSYDFAIDRLLTVRQDQGEEQVHSVQVASNSVFRLLKRPNNPDALKLLEQNPRIMEKWNETMRAIPRTPGHLKYVTRLRTTLLDWLPNNDPALNMQKAIHAMYDVFVLDNKCTKPEQYTEDDKARMLQAYQMLENAKNNWLSPNVARPLSRQSSIRVGPNANTASRQPPPPPSRANSMQLRTYANTTAPPLLNRRESFNTRNVYIPPPTDEEVQQALKVLELGPDASWAAVRKRFYERLSDHPDRNKSPNANKKFQPISAAYEVMKRHMMRSPNASMSRASSLQARRSPNASFSGFRPPPPGRSRSL